jgi:hypothetical protein
LEFTIRVRLGRVLRLKEVHRDIVTGSYDFAMLCTVTREAMLAKKRASKKRKEAVNAFFKACHGLANPNRSIVADALWTVIGASHVSRNTLQRQFHYRDLDELRDLTRWAKALMSKMILEEI